MPTRSSSTRATSTPPAPSSTPRTTPSSFSTTATSTTSRTRACRPTTRTQPRCSHSACATSSETADNRPTRAGALPARHEPARAGPVHDGYSPAFVYTAEPGSLAEEALDLLASRAATLDEEIHDADHEEHRRDRSRAE